MDIVTSILAYLAVMLGNDPDPLNDWLTHLPPAVADQLYAIGIVIAYVRQLTGH